MRATGTFTLRIQRDEDHEPTRVAVTILGAMQEVDGTFVVTPDCMTLDDETDAEVINLHLEAHPEART